MRCLLLTCALCLLAAATATAQMRLPERQEELRARMERIEGRLLELTALAQDAGRRQSVQRALEVSRREFLVQNMQRIRDMLAEGRYDEAAALQRDVMEDLERLAALLEGDDTTERLAALRRAAADLEELLERQSDALERTRRFATEAQDPQSYRRLSEEQQQMAQSAAALGTDLRDEAAGQHVASAAEAMRAAAAALAGQQAGQAMVAQSEARSRLEAARAALQRALQRLEAERRDRLRGQLKELLDELLREQRAVRTATDELAGAIAGTERLSRAQRLRLARLAERQRAVSPYVEQARSLLEQMGPTAAWPEAFSQLGALVDEAAGLVRDGRPAEAVPVQQAVEALVEGLLEVLRARERLAESEPPPPPTRRDEEDTRRPMDVPEELRVLRALQSALNRASEALAGRNAPREQVHSAAEGLADRQEGIRSGLGEVAGGLPGTEPVQRLMADSARMLRRQELGETLQGTQQRIIGRLDALIAAARQAAASRAGAQEGPAPAMQTGRQTGIPDRPAEESRLPAGRWEGTAPSLTGPPVGGWLPELPEAERRRIEDAFETGRLPARYREHLRQYNRRLAGEDAASGM
ncbi:MAG: hypothetical protein R6V05_02960 [Candidatus Brocadiia bacterium]